MKKHVRVYIEGGSTGSVADSDFRRGWKKFLVQLHETARANGYVSLEVVRGKSRSNTFKRFKAHKNTYPNDLCVLLVDAETNIVQDDNVWEVVTQRDGDNWDRPDWASDRHLYLMVAFVETWLLTDRDALQEFFKQGFNISPLPQSNLEGRSKATVEAALKQATRNCKSGVYRHGQAHGIIEKVRPDRVQTLRHGRRLFVELTNLINEQ